MPNDALQAELEDLRRRLEEAEETLHAIRSGSVDAVVVEELAGHRVYTLEGADRPYRLLVEQMQQGAATLLADGSISYCNLSLADLLLVPHERLIGVSFGDFIAAQDRAIYDELMARGRHRSGGGEVRVQRSDGALVPVYLTINVLPEGCGADVGVLVTDLTSQRHHEQLATAHRDLRLSEMTRRFAMKAAGAGSWTWDRDSGDVIWSEETYELFGLDPTAPLSYESWRDVLHPDDRDRADAAARRAMDRCEDLVVEYRVRHPINGERWLTSIGRIVDPDGRPGRMHGISLDITEAKQAEELLRQSEQHFRHMADAVPVLIWVSDETKACTWFNKYWLDFSGRSMQDLLGWGWADDVHPDDAARCMDVYITHFDRRQPFEMEYRQRRHDGEYRWVIDAGTPWFDPTGEFVGYVGSCSDFTDRRAAEEHLRQLTADLSAEAQRKDEFLAVLAHELRNPLAPIQNAVEILRLSGANPGTVQGAASVLGRQVGHMVRLVDDLLDVGRISRGKIELRRSPVELASIVEHAVEVARPMLQGLNHELTVSMPSQPIALNADSVRLAQALGNLLNNAAKFTQRGGQIRLTVELAGPQVVIRVRDDGIGIAPHELPRIFEMFAQVARSSDRTQTGLGIGLTLVKKLVELHGGTVTADSGGIGQGSEFVVRLPVATETVRPVATHPIDEAPEHLMRRRVLVVDDNVDSARSLAAVLEFKGHQTEMAHDGEQALATAAAFKPDLVLLDIGLPKLDGYEVARKIRQQSWGRDIMLIAVTGWGQQEDRRRSQAAGFDIHFVKPLDHLALMKVIATPPAGKGS